MNSRQPAKDCANSAVALADRSSSSQMQCARASHSWLRLVLSAATPCTGEENIWVYTNTHLLSHWNFMHRACMRHSKSLAWLSVSLLVQAGSKAQHSNTFFVLTKHLQVGTRHSPFYQVCPRLSPHGGPAHGPRRWCCHLSATRSSAGAQPAAPLRPAKREPWNPEHDTDTDRSCTASWTSATRDIAESKNNYTSPLLILLPELVLFVQFKYFAVFWKKVIKNWAVSSRTSN